MVSIFEPAQLGPIDLKNRFVKAATFEGRTRRGEVTDELIEFHRVTAAGGVAMTTVAYLAVSPDGRTDRHCVLLREEALPGLTRLTSAVHGEGAKISAQIGHAGPVANGRSNGSPSLAPSSGMSPMGARLHEASVRDLERIVGDYASSADIAKQAGFDCIEIHMGHNYLISSFLSPKLNRRKDEYGGSLENRARLARTVADAVRTAVGSDIAVTAKLNMDDGVRGGFGVTEAAQVAKWLQDDGSIDAIELTGGSSLSNPMYLFRGDAPRAEFAQTLPQPIRLGFKVVGRHFMPSYPFEEAYFIDQARVVLEGLHLPVILLGGITRPETAQAALDEGFSFFALGRPLLMEPGIINRWASGDNAPSACTHCNKCMPSIYTGTKCVENGGPVAVSSVS
jgi:2,4-dienoyl-CoA reductase-like NADH-dependent reductase (Old Yellow Enzyme family)